MKKLLFLLLPSALCAVETAPAATPEARVQAPAQPEVAGDTSKPEIVAMPSKASEALETAQAISDADLDTMRGGQTIVVGNQTLNASTTGNTLQGDYFAGDISLSDNALTAFTGMGNFAINTGAQVSLQSGMNVVINLGQ